MQAILDLALHGLRTRNYLHLLIDFLANELQLKLLRPHSLDVCIKQRLILASLLALQECSQSGSLLVQSITLSSAHLINLGGCLVIFELIILFKVRDEFACLTYLANSRMIGGK